MLYSTLVEVKVGVELGNNDNDDDYEDDD